MTITRHKPNPLFLDTDAIAEMVMSYSELRRQGLSRNYIYRALHDQRALTLRRGIYISTQEWGSLGDWGRYFARLIALAKKSPQTLFSHHSAALLHGLWLTGQPPERIHVYSSPRSRGDAHGVVKHPFLGESTIRVSTSSGLAATGIVQTVIDCALTSFTREAVIIADSALHLGKVTPAELMDAMTVYDGRRRVQVQRVAQLMSAHAESPGETGTRLLLNEMGVAFIEQYEVQLGHRRYRVDFFLPEFNMIIEFDGELKYTAFGARSQVETMERSREKELQNLGYVVYRADWATVFHQPQRFKREVLALAQRTGRNSAPAA